MPSHSFDVTIDGTKNSTELIVQSLNSEITKVSSDLSNNSAPDS